MSIQFTYPHQAPCRLSDIDLEKVKGIFSKSQWKKLIKLNQVFVNQELAKTSTFVSKPDVISYIPVQSSSNSKPFKLKLDILFEDEHLAIIHKPAGIPVSGNVFKSIQNALIFNLKPTFVSDQVQNPLTCHRLDAATSGLLLVSKHQESRILIGKAFETGEIQKQYYAIVHGKPESRKGTWIQTIDEKSSESRFEILKSIDSLHGKLSLLKLEPITGRTHQLRKHCTFNGCPIVGDKLYDNQYFGLKSKGLFLQAFSLKFKHPITKELIELKESLAYKFSKLLDREFERFELNT